jgi:photosystem II stability/assembly factor-like uncharacterized protein
MKTSNIILLIVIVFIAIPLNAEHSWEKLNGPYGGRLDCIGIDESGNLYSGMEHLYKSTDNGENWFKIDLPPISESYWLKNIIVSNGHLLISYWEGHSDVWSGWVMESSDGGNSWHSTQYYNSIDAWLKKDNEDYLIADGNRISFYNLDSGTYQALGMIDSNYAEVKTIIYDKDGNLLAGCEMSPWGIYRSTDDGKTWDSVSLQGYDVHSLLLKENGDILAGTDKGIRISQDGGFTWALVVLDNSRIYKIVRDSLKNLYACTDYKGLYSSNDNGINWQKTSLQSNSVFGALVNQSGDVFTINEYDGVWRLKKDSINWEEKNNGLDNLLIYTVAVDKNNRILAGTLGRGLYSSDDGGQNWTNIFNYFYVYDNDVYSIALDSLGNIYVSTSNGVYSSIDSGKTWKDVFDIYPGGNTIIKADKNNNIFYVDDYRGLYLIKQKDSTFRNILTQEIVGDAFLIDKNGFLFAGKYNDWKIIDNGIYFSKDFGDSWYVLRNGIDPDSRNYSLLEMPDGSLLLNTSKGLLVSYDVGQNWNVINDSLWNIGDLICNSKSSLFGIGSPEQVYISRDKGISWNPYLDTLPRLDYYSLCLDNNDVLYVCTSSGIFKSTIPTDVKSENELEQIDFKVFPNPASNFATFIYYLPERVNIRLSLVNILGQELFVLANGLQEKGSHYFQYSFQKNNLNGGIYFIRLQSGVIVRTIKVILIK